MFKTSVEVQVSVFGEHPFEDEKEPFFVLDAFVTLVSVDDDMNPQQLHFVLQPASENQVHRMEVSRCDNAATAGETGNDPPGTADVCCCHDRTPSSGVRSGLNCVKVASWLHEAACAFAIWWV